ncbi:MAG: helix-turn-helix transcriptional regulator [Oscillospiraceae bacterium]|nr:helix-turn-helix transcriptional regulator [Oscillospiraceae bacterium]
MRRAKLQAARRAANLTQQQMADKLGLTLRHYQKIEYAEISGSFEVWDALEDLLGVHQRILRETSNNHRAPKENQQGLQGNQSFLQVTAN